MSSVAKQEIDFDGVFRCLACGSLSRRLLQNVIDVERPPNSLLPPKFSVWICNICGLGELSAKLNAAQLEFIYPPTYYSYAKSSSAYVARFRAWFERLRYSRYRRIPPFSSLLEIGCGSGEFLASISTRGKVVGLERSLAARDAARKRGVDVRVGDIEDDGLFAPGEFDCVYLNHTLEHLIDPERVLRAIGRVLAPGGTLYIGVPNIAGFAARIAGSSWYALAAPEHVTHWTPKAIRLVLRRTGFNITNLSFHSDPNSLPQSWYYAFGGRRTDLTGAHPAKIIILALGFALLPFTRIVDFVGAGDLMEITALKTVDGNADALVAEGTR